MAKKSILAVQNRHFSRRQRCAKMAIMIFGPTSDDDNSETESLEIWCDDSPIVGLLPHQLSSNLDEAFPSYRCRNLRPDTDCTYNPVTIQLTVSAIRLDMYAIQSFPT